MNHNPFHFISRTWRRTLVLLSGLILFTACPNDPDSTPVPIIEDKAFVGEWVELYNTEDNTEAIDFTLSKGFMVIGMAYENVDTSPVVYERISGTWVYSQTNQIFGMTVYHSFTGKEISESYKVNHIDNYSMILQEQETGMIRIFLKVLHTEELQIGKTLSLSSVGIPADFNVVSMESSCPNIVSVDGKGQFTANKQGIVFITLHSTTTKAIIKIEVI